jgi:hypothetical protein
MVIISISGIFFLEFLNRFLINWFLKRFLGKSNFQMQNPGNFGISIDLYIYT